MSQVLAYHFQSQITENKNQSISIQIILTESKHAKNHSMQADNAFSRLTGEKFEYNPNLEKYSGGSSHAGPA